MPTQPETSVSELSKLTENQEFPKRMFAIYTTFTTAKYIYIFYFLNWTVLKSSIDQTDTTDNKLEVNNLDNSTNNKSTNFVSTSTLMTDSEDTENTCKGTIVTLPSVLQLTRLEKATGRWEPLDCHYPLPPATNTWAYWMEFIENADVEEDIKDQNDDEKTVQFKK